MKRTLPLLLLPFIVPPLAGCQHASERVVVASTTVTSATGLDAAQIAEIVRAALAELVDQADLVRGRATTPALRDFTVVVGNDYRVLLRHGIDLRHVLGLLPTRSTISQDVADDARAKRQVLDVEGPSDFDLAAIQTQVSTHVATLNLIDASLLPAVHEPALRASLFDLRRAVAFHLEEARRIQGLVESESVIRVLP